MRRHHVPPGRTSILLASVVKPCGPHHRTRCSGWVEALKTRGRGASKTRVTTSSRSAVTTSSRSVDAVAVLVLGAIGLVRLLKVAQIVLEAIQALLPETPIMLEPVGGILERARGEPAGPPLRLAAAGDQACALQHLQML